jgi:type I restriction enzyme S subunit
MYTLPFTELVEINPHVKIEKAKEYPFIEMGIVEPGRRYVRANQNRIFQGGGAKFLPGDTLFARITPCLENGKIVQYNDPDGHAGFGSTEFFVFRARPGISDPGFIYYLAKSDSIRKPAEKSMSGASGRQRADLKSIVDLKVPSPPLPTQRKIAAVLSAYDDLIENNLRQIKILEEMAQNLYREWFVKFRFPGHQHARFVDSPLGRIPEGWEVLPFTEITDVLSGGTPKTTVQEYWGGSIPFFAPKDAPKSFYITNTEKTITEIGLRKCNSNLYPKDTVFITARGTVGKVVMPSMDMAMNQSCYALRAKQGISQLYLFLVTREQVDYLKKNTGGATFDTIVVDTFRRMEVTRPGNEVIIKFSQLIQPGMELILNILKKNTALRRTRDLLLPKLISGEVDVSALDITVPEEVAI